MSALTEYRYNRLTWPEMNDAIKMQKVVILPTGSTEQHGRHLPLDTDVFLAEEVCLEVGRRASDRVLILPPISYGLNMHHIDFPGTIHIEPDVFINFCLNITKSVAYHGFQKILLVNGHGSNTALIDIIARKTILETQSICAALTYIPLGMDAFNQVKETETIAHADEYETSLYLYLASERVQVNEMLVDDDVTGKYMSSDSTSNFPVRMSDYWGRWTKHGVHGDPSRATKEKGKIIFDAVTSRLIEIVDELRAWPVAERVDQHISPIQSQIRW